MIDRRRPITGLATMLDAGALRKPDMLIESLDPLLGLSASATPVRISLAEMADYVNKMAANLGPLLNNANSRPRVLILRENSLECNLLAITVAKCGGLPLLVNAKAWETAGTTFMRKFAPHYFVGDKTMFPGVGRPSVPFFGDLYCADSGISQEDVPPPEVTGTVQHYPVLCTHTSGTTGDPKIVVHSDYSMLMNQARTESLRWAFWSGKKRDKYLSAVSFSHVRSLVWLNSQMRNNIQSIATTGTLSGRGLLEAAREVQPTMVEAIPSGFQEAASQMSTSEWGFKRVRYFMNTFDAIHSRTVEAFLKRTKQPIAVWGQGWAQSEVGPLAITFYVKTGRVAPVPRKFIGIAAPGVRFSEGEISQGSGAVEAHSATRDAVTNLATKRDRAERLLLAKSGGRALGYFREAQLTRDTYLHAGWWSTGDVGRVIARRGVVLDGRADDCVTGIGSVIEFEGDVLARIPSLVEAVLVDVGTDEGGRRPVLVASPSSSSTVSEGYLRAELEHYLPANIHVCVVPYEELPVTGTGKVRRSAVRDKIRDSTGR